MASKAMAPIVTGALREVPPNLRKRLDTLNGILKNNATKRYFFTPGSSKRIH